MTTPGAGSGVSRQTLLALLLGLAPELTGEPPPVDAGTRERMLAWDRRQPPGPLSLSGAPLDGASLPGLRERLHRLGSVLAGWTRDGRWVIGRDDPAYPKRLRRRLGEEAPALLFGSGEQDLVARGGVAVVRGAAAEPDQVAVLDTALADSMLGLITLGSGSNSIGVARVAERAAKASLALVPPGVAPADRAALEACCYALADTVVTVGLGRDDPEWQGVTTLIARDKQPVWVHGVAGDAVLLVRAGAHAIPPGLLAGGADGLLLPGRALRRPPDAGARPSGPTQPMPQPTLVRGFSEAQAVFGAGAARPPARSAAPMLRLVPEIGRAEAGTTPDPADAEPTLFELFVRRLASLLSHGPLGAGRIAEAMDLTRPQVDAWLLRAEAQGQVRSDTRTRLFALP